MGKIPKKRLLSQIKREYERLKSEDPRLVVMTTDVESRFLAMKRAEARKNCPLCGALLKPEFSGYCRGAYEDWWVEKVCPNCGVIKETASGTRKMDKSCAGKTLGNLPSGFIPDSLPHASPKNSKG